MGFDHIVKMILRSFASCKLAKCSVIQKVTMQVFSIVVILASWPFMISQMISFRILVVFSGHIFTDIKLIKRPLFLHIFTVLIVYHDS
jgi:hypothetical protein